VKRIVACICAIVSLTSVLSAQESKLPQPFATGLKAPVSACVGSDGRVYVTDILDDGGGRVMVIGKTGEAIPFATGLKNPIGIVAWTNLLFVADDQRVVRIDPKGKVTVLADEKKFPGPPVTLYDICADEHGILYVSDWAIVQGGVGAIFRIDQKGKVTTVTDGKKNRQIKSPTGLVMDGKNHLLTLDSASGQLLRINVNNAQTTTIAYGLRDGRSLVWDHFGRLFISTHTKKASSVYAIPRPGQQPIRIASGAYGPTGLCLDPTGRFLLISNSMAGTLTKIPTTIPGWEVDESPLPLKTEVAFPDLKWTGWQGITDAGKQYPLRPLVLTHPGDASNRVFVAIQQGIIHVFPNDPKADKTKIFLDMQKQVFYNDNENEQGLLGLAFHPKYKTNGEFFIFYTLKKDKTTNIISRFKVSKDDPNKADMDSEQVLFKIKRPFWNHDGGTICFGPDGYLYVTLGDGGAADDPFKNGQNLKTLLAKVLRLDVDHKDDGKQYAVPKDNPFVGNKDALPEIWAYGLRNIWRMSFDHKTGKLWASDVGQNLYEEINIIVKGGNYGWSLREGLHPFSSKGVDANKDMIEPVWEYHHAIGKSLTGGHVYRGKRLPELDGFYLYGDYITTKIWGLRYDEAKKRVVANRPIRDPNVPILSFGEDEQGEVYLLTTTVSGQGIRQFVPQDKTARPKADPGPHKTASISFDWKDTARDRVVPVKIWHPKDMTERAPVVVFSHGTGGSREGYAYLGQFWASHGYVCVHPQHAGSDSEIFKGNANILDALKKAALNPKNAVERPKDISFVLDQLAALNKDHANFKRKLNLDAVGLAGHSFGAHTTMVIAGQTLGSLAVKDRRIKAVVPMSAAAPAANLERAFADIKIPTLLMSGTLDDSPIGGTKAKDRRVPFDKIAGADKFFLNFDGGDHMIFSGRFAKGSYEQRKMDADFQRCIKQSSLAFWDAYLKNDDTARAWLSGKGLAEYLGKLATVEVNLNN
jgi:predicted dienelactone hydrolase/glucose/arabinose dehydrogenase/sugar lactone lactonase YvrE